jgi:hypothetical protein
MKFKTLTMAIATTLFTIGCATHDAPVTDSSEIDALRAEVAKQEAQKAELRGELAAMERSQEAANKALEASKSAGTNSMADLPPNARAGECYARVFEPPTYTTETRNVLSRAASEKLEIVPATYEWVEETVMTKPEGVRLETVPATYKWVEKTVVVEPERTVLKEVPAKYATETEQVLIKEAYTTWKKGRGPIERLNEATGEIMCLVEVPAEYKTVTRTVMTAAPTTREEVIPAKTKVVRTQVMTAPAKTVEIKIPAEYETVKIRKLASRAREQRMEIPAEYQTVEETRLVKEGKLHWQPILCETNASPNLISNVQRALNEAGFNAGPVDGVLGQMTSKAIGHFQRANGLSSGQLTIETLEKLGVKI